MKKPILFVMMVLTTFLSGCNMGEKMFIASGYSGNGAADVMLCRLNQNGIIEKLSEFTVGDNPSYFTFGSDGLVYFINEADSFNLAVGGGITTLRIDVKAGTFEKAGLLNQGGGGPCHIVLSDDKKHLVTANYGSGSVSVVKLNGGGIPDEVTDVIFYGEKSHPHMTLFNSRTGFYYISDLGLDRIHILRLDTLTGRLLNGDIPFITSDTGSGPRHMLIDKQCSNLYVINELASTISVYDILSETPLLKQTLSTLPEGFEGKNYCADIHFSVDSKKIHGSNRGNNSIVTFDIGPDGTLSSPRHQPCGGDWPRNFAMSPDGKFFLVANQRSNEVSVIPAGANSGEAYFQLPLNAPACVRFLK
ncbi:MAG: lactonase family protein [Bacteroidales bacterium]|nr:lactonase family protein [Bacteroidales bacterium]